MEGTERTAAEVAVDWLRKGFDAVREAGRRYISEAEERAAFDEYSQGVNRATAALVDVCNDKAAIAEALHEHWGVDLQEAEERVQWEMRVYAPARRLERFLVEKQHFTKAEAGRYLRENAVKIKLRHDPKLSTMKQERLYREIENTRA